MILMQATVLIEPREIIQFTIRRMEFQYLLVNSFWFADVSAQEQTERKILQLYFCLTANRPMLYVLIAAMSLGRIILKKQGS